MRRFIAALILCAPMSTCAVAPAFGQSAELIARMHDLNAWVRLHTSYKATHLPKIVFRTREDMARTYYGEHYRPDLATFIRAMAVKGTVFLPPDVKADGSDDWLLLHELVHFQQFEAGRGEVCAGEREREAYALQDLFVASSGRGEKSDPMTVLSHLASCSGY